MPPAPKQPGSQRKASSSLSKATAAPATQSKASKPSQIIHLKLSTEILARFPREQSVRKPSQAKASPSLKHKPLSTDEKAKAAASKPEVKSETDNKTMAEGSGDLQSPPKDIDNEEPADSKTGDKRPLGVGVEGDPTAKAKSGGRKRPRVGENGRIDGRTAAAKALGVSAGLHKLGPKANQGAINAGLRALDRTRKPCRKWVKTGFRVKSFTGRMWEVPSWRAPHPKAFGSGSSTQPGTSNDQSKVNSSSNVGSDKSPAGENPNVASSPVPIAPAPT